MRSRNHLSRVTKNNELDAHFFRDAKINFLAFGLLTTRHEIFIYSFRHVFSSYRLIMRNRIYSFKLVANCKEKWYFMKRVKSVCVAPSWVSRHICLLQATCFRLLNQHVKLTIKWIKMWQRWRFFILKIWEFHKKNISSFGRKNCVKRRCIGFNIKLFCISGDLVERKSIKFKLAIFLDAAEICWNFGGDSWSGMNKTADVPNAGITSASSSLLWKFHEENFSINFYDVIWT